MVVGEFGYNLVVPFVGVLYPLFQTFKAIKSDSAQDWLPYWLVFVLFGTISYPIDLLFSWFSLYYILKLGIVVALQPHSLNVAKKLYDKQLEPVLIKLDTELSSNEHIIQTFAAINEFKKMSGPEKWRFVKELDLTNSMQWAQGVFQALIPTKGSPTEAPSKAEGERTAEGKSTAEGLPPAPLPEAPASPDHQSGSDDLELIEKDDAMPAKARRPRGEAEPMD